MLGLVCYRFLMAANNPITVRDLYKAKKYKAFQSNVKLSELKAAVILFCGELCPSVDLF